MKQMNRRQFLQTLTAGTALAGLGFPAIGKAAGSRIVVIGGGTGGATVAKYLRLLDSSLDVTLIEKNPTYTTCYMSNEVLSGERSLASLQFGYDGLRARGVTVVHDEVVMIDPVGQVVQTKNGNSYAYDRCVVSPGVDFRYDTVAGYDATIADTSVPHAWKAGAQTTLLRDQIHSMENGGTVIVAAPPNPYRCPPAPYERASQIAYYLKQHKPNSKVIILDPKVSFAKKDLFEDAWKQLYGYGSANAQLEWVSGDDAAGVVELQASTADAPKTVITEFGEQFTGAVVNIIPAQQAGSIAFKADLVDSTGWCPVNRQTFESTLHANIHIIGDACQANSLPKSGFAANSEAKVCAAAIVALLNGDEVPSPTFANGCYSIVGENYAISVVGVYRLSDDGSVIQGISGSGGTSPRSASTEARRLDTKYAHGWYNNFTQDVFF